MTLSAEELIEAVTAAAIEIVRPRGLFVSGAGLPVFVQIPDGTIHRVTGVVTHNDNVLLQAAPR